MRVLDAEGSKGEGGRERERDRKFLLSFVHVVEGIERARDEEPTGSTLNPSRISIQCLQYHASTRSRRSSVSTSNRPPRISIVIRPIVSNLSDFFTGCPSHSLKLCDDEDFCDLLRVASMIHTLSLLDVFLFLSEKVSTSRRKYRFL